MLLRRRRNVIHRQPRPRSHRGLFASFVSFLFVYLLGYWSAPLIGTYVNQSYGWPSALLTRGLPNKSEHISTADETSRTSVEKRSITDNEALQPQITIRPEFHLFLEKSAPPSRNNNTLLAHAIRSNRSAGMHNIIDNEAYQTRVTMQPKFDQFLEKSVPLNLNKTHYPSPASSIKGAVEKRHINKEASQPRVTMQPKLLETSAPTNPKKHLQKSVSNFYNKTVNANRIFRNVTCYSKNRGTCNLKDCSTFTPTTQSPSKRTFRGSILEIEQSQHNGSRPSASCKACAVYARQCAVSQRYKFIYIHVPKSGGSSAHQFLKSALCTPTGSKKFGEEHNCSEAILNFGFCNSVLNKYPHYFKWTIVRHPFPRAISAWAMANRRLESGSPLPFNEWALDPSKLKTAVWRMHWWPQTFFLMDDALCPLFDYAAVLDGNFGRSLEEVLAKLDCLPLWRHYRSSGFPHAYRTPDTVRRVRFANLTEAARQALAARYQHDFGLFGFEPTDWEQDGYF